ncbi:N-6 DNA methylase, partial [Planctomycetota bacterium]|nr:N-6 DNA methylase [Planctomycetota bacterium]
VFTPRLIARQLAHEAFSRWQHDRAPDVLDPACGHGALLLGAIEWATEHRPNWLKHWANGGLAGWELHADVAVQCRLALKLALGDCQIKQRDSLQSDDRDVADVVLSNPPWVSYSGRHAHEIDAGRKRELSKRYAAFAGWPSLHAAFSELCVLLTRQEGLTGLLVPQQMSDLNGYAKCREVIAESATLIYAQELGEDVFAGVTEPAGLFVFRKSPAGNTNPWRSQEHPDWLKHALRFSPLPAECFKDPGVHTGNSAKLLIAKSPESGTEPVYVGRDVSPFSLAPPSHWMRKLEPPEGHYFRISKCSLYENADILIRQTAARPIVAPHQPRHLFRNSVLACYLPDDHDLDFLLAILNSDAMARIHQALHRDGRQKAFPQMKVGHLRALPIPPTTVPEYELVAKLGKQARQGRPNLTELNEVVELAYFEDQPPISAD